MFSTSAPNYGFKVTHIAIIIIRYFQILNFPGLNNKKVIDNSTIRVETIRDDEYLYKKIAENI
jgi:hypothetical protein